MIFFYNIDKEGFMYSNGLIPVSHTSSPTLPPPEDREVVKKRLHRKLKDFSEEDLRVFYFLELRLSNIWGQYVHYDKVDLQHFLVSQLLNYYPHSDTQLDYLVSIKTHHTTPNHYLTWLSNDFRASLFFGTYLEYDLSSVTLYGENYYIKFIHYMMKISSIFIDHDNVIHVKEIDFRNNTPAQFITTQNLEEVKRYYLKNRTPLKLLKWLNIKDEEQIDWAYDYLLERENIILNEIFYPKNSLEKYNLILASFDSFDTTEKQHKVKNGSNTLALSDREFKIYKIRRAWNSILNTKKKVNEKTNRIITVYEKNYDKLLQLSKYTNTSPSKYINKFINDEYEKIYGKLDDLSDSKIISEHY